MSQLQLEMLDGAGRERMFRSPALIAGALVTVVVIATFLYFSDQNAERWEIRCAQGQAIPRRGMYFPWGTRQISDDAHDVLHLPEGVSCASVRMSSLAELDRTLGAMLLESAEHRLQQGGPEALARARQNVERARRLQGITEDQRRQSEALVADMAYHEAREILRQIERSLWQARRKLERAQRLGAGTRIGDLEDWLRFIELETERFRPAIGEVPTPDRPEPPPPQPPPPPSEDVFL